MSAFPLVVTEGLLEVPAAQKVLTALGIEHEETRLVPKGGKNALWRDAMKYNHAAQHVGPVLGVTDLEQSPRPSGLIAQYLPHGRHPLFILRIAEHIDIVPPEGSEGIVGRGYLSQMTEFIRNSWRPHKASANSDSLRRALVAIQTAAA